MKKYVRSSKAVKAASEPYDNRFTYTRGNQKFAVYTFNEYDPDSFKCQVSELHAYDDADYAWGEKDRPNSVAIYQGGKRIKRIQVPEWDADMYETENEYYDEVIDRICVALRNINRGVEPRMMHN